MCIIIQLLYLCLKAGLVKTFDIYVFMEEHMNAFRHTHTQSFGSQGKRADFLIIVSSF